MNPEILKRMTGEELLLLRILNGVSLGPPIEAELDRRAGSEPVRHTRTRHHSVARHRTQPVAA